MYPDEDQNTLLKKHFGSRRFVWNHFLDLRNRQYVDTGKGLAYKKMQSLLTSLKEQDEWLREVKTQSLQPVLQNLDTAFHIFFRKIGKYPVLSKKRSGGSFSVPQHFTINGNHLIIPKFKTPLRLFVHRNIEGETRSLTISKTQSEKYYVSILTWTEMGMPESAKVEACRSVGIDMGIKALMTPSDGLQIHDPENLKKS